MINLRTLPGDICCVWIRTEDRIAKEIKCSLEVVAVYADHPPKIKSDTCFRVREITKCISLYWICTYLASSDFCSIYREFCPHLVFTSCETLTLRMMWPVTIFERLIWHWLKVQQRPPPCAFNEFGWTVTGQASRGLCSAGIINTPTTLFNALGRTWTSALCF